MKRILYTLIGIMLSTGAWADTLQEQINSAADGATITLTEDMTISQTVLINKNITIDGGSHTITSNVNNKLGTFYINTGTCNFTIQNATIDGGNTASMAVVAYRGTANSGLTTVDSADRNNNNSGNVINMTNCTVKNFTGFPGSYAGAVYVFGQSSANLTNCTFSGNTTSLQSTDGASGADVWAGAAAKVNISGGSYQEVFVNSNKTNNASITISNGAKVEELSVCVTENGSSTNQPSITVDNASVINITTETGNTIPSTAVTTKNGGTVTNIPTEYVAQIGDKKYSSLISAINAATAGQTISLLSNVTISTVDELTITKALTLDLAGHTITSTVEEPIIVKSDGDLTITGNGTIAGPTGEAGEARDGYAIITVERGKLTYLNGTLTCGGVGSDGMYGVYILNGGTAIFGEEAGKTGPTITSWFAAIGENNTTAPANITVYGGSYTAQASPSDSDWWSYFCAPIYAAGSGEINISGGEFNGYYGLSSRYSNIDQDLNITGGTFTGTKSALFFDNKSGVESSESREVAVSGGTFSSAVPEEYCANGFIPTENADGTYGVKAGSYVAQVGDTKYETLTAAVEAANDGDEITLLDEITISEVLKISKSVTIDLNGNNINAEAMIYVNGNGKNVTIKDGQATESPAVDADHNVTYNSGKITTAESIFYIYNSATLTLESGTLESTGSYPIYIDDDDAAYFVMNGGYVHGAEFAISLWASTTVQINVGVVKSDDQAAITGNGTAKWSTEKGTTVNVTGGTIIAKSKTTGDISCGIYNPQAGVVNISGGTIYADNGAGVVMRAGDLNITGGEIVTTGTGKGLVGDAKNVVPMSAVVVDVDAKYPCNTINDLGVAVTGGTLTSADGVDAITILNEEKTKETKNIVSVTGATLSGPIYTTETFSMTDDNAPYAFDNYRVKKAEYTRQGVSATTWGTICLPFSITAAENGYKYYIPESVSADELTITEITEFPIAVGTPVIFQKEAGDVEISSTEATVNKNATAGSGTGSVVLVGTFENKTITSGLSNIYFINGDHFHQAQVSLTVPAYRAYINYAGTAAKPSVLSILVGGEATGVEKVSMENESVEGIYDVNGMKLSAPKKGMNIMKLANGKTVKLIVK